MKSRHQLSKTAVEQIKRFEGYRRASAALADGRYTIGYGHTKTARANVEIDERDAEALLIYDLLAVTGAVNDLTFTPLTQNQFDALVSFAFNIGVDNFKGSSVLRRVNEGNLLQAASALEMWRKSEFEGERIVVDALIRRRAAEKALFLTPTDGFVPAPSPVLPPRIDYEVVTGSSREQAHRLVTPLEGETTEPHSEGAEPVAPMTPAEDASPVTVAAEAFAARLRALEPVSEPEEDATPVEAPAESEAPAPEPEAPVEPEPEAPVADALSVQETPPAEVEAQFEPIVEPAAETPAEPVEPVEVPEVMEAVRETPELNIPRLILSPLEPQDAEFEPLAEPVEEPRNDFDPEAAALPFEAPDQDDEPALILAPPTPTPRGWREPTSYFRQHSLRFDHMAKPMLASPLSLVGLFVAGLGLIAFALVWGASTIAGGAMSTIAWVIGLIGVGAIVTAFYLFVTRIGGSED